MRAGMVVYDVGAGIGLWTLSAARLAGSTGAVYAFETDASRRTRLQEHVAHNALTTVTVVASDTWPSLDDFAARTRPPDVIRCDGIAALMVLESAARILTERRPIVLCGAQAAERAALESVLGRFGYGVGGADGGSVVAEPRAAPAR